MADMSLKQRLFAEAYIGPAQGNATQAARIAGYAGNDRTLQSVGSTNLRKPAIAERIEERVAEAAATADEILREVSAIALSPMESFIQVRTNGRGEIVDAKINLTDKLKACELIGRYRGLWVDGEAKQRDEGPVRTLLYAPPKGFESSAKIESDEDAER